jgi:hypothetical protein
LILTISGPFPNVSSQTLEQAQDMLRETVFQQLSAIRNTIDGCVNGYFSSRPKGLVHIEGKEYKGSASSPA